MTRQHVGLRIAYMLVLGGGYSNPLQVWEWCCSACAFRPRDRDKAELEKQMHAHRCAA